MEPVDAPIMLSALQHYSYCPRQYALIYQESSFDDNEFTLRGQRAHQRVDSGEISLESDLKVVRSLPLYSKRLNLTGKADVVEFLADGTPYPVEYKQGHRQKKLHDDIQLVAQALCLEEMMGLPVPEGAIYHHQTRRRRVVKITPVLRQQVVDVVQAITRLLDSDRMPPPANDPALCRGCSLKEVCQPELVLANAKLKQVSRSLFIPGEGDGL